MVEEPGLAVQVPTAGQNYHHDFLAPAPLLGPAAELIAGTGQLEPFVSLCSLLRLLGTCGPRTQAACGQGIGGKYNDAIY
jgi:hypothetical protein